MKLEVLEDLPLEKKFLFTYSQQEISECLEEKAQELQPETNLKGFRPGKAPLGHILRVYGEKIRLDVMQKKITDDIKDIVEKNDFRLMVSPIYNFEERKEVGDENFYVNLTLYLTPDIPDCDFSKGSFKKYGLTEEAFEKLLDRNLIMLQVLSSEFEENTEGSAGEHDRVTFSMSVQVEGEVAEDISGDRTIVLGLEQLPDFIENPLMGMKTGEVKTFNHEFDKHQHFFGHNLSEKNVEFTVVLDKIETPLIYEFDTERLKGMGFENADSLVESLRQSTTDMVNRVSKEKYFDDITNYIANTVDFEIAEAVVLQEAHQISLTDESRLKHTDAMSDAFDGKKELAIEEQHKERALKNLKMSLYVVDYLKKNNIEVEEKEVSVAMEKNFKELANMNKAMPERKEQNFQEFFAFTKAHVGQMKALDHISADLSPEELLVDYDQFIDLVSKKTVDLETKELPSDFDQEAS